MKRPLSKRQQEIMSYIQDFMSRNSYPPTVRDIQYGCEISSTSVVDYNLQILQREGYLQRKREVSRSIELLKDPSSGSRDVVKVPVLGNIAAGEPLPLAGSGPWDNPDFDTVDLPPFLTKGRPNVFVILDPVNQPDNGDMVAAWLKDREEATLKHFYLDGDIVRLQPANAQMETIVVAAADVAVRGRVVGIVRTM